MSAEPKVVHKPSLTFKRRLNAAPKKSTPHGPTPKKREVVRPDAGPVKSAKLDVREGGRYAIVFLNPGRRGASGKRDLPRGGAEPQARLLLRLAHHAGARVAGDNNDQTGRRWRALLTLFHEQLFDEERDRHEHGWTGCLAKLEAFLT